MKRILIIVGALATGFAIGWFIPAEAHCVNPTIKGNITPLGVHIYHVPGGKYYSRTIIDRKAGERMFCTEKGAIEAGWRKSAL